MSGDGSCGDCCCGLGVIAAGKGVVAGVAAVVLVPAVGFWGGCLYGMVSGPVEWAVELAMKSLDCDMDELSGFSKVLAVAAALFVGAVVGWAIAALVGVPITFAVACGISLLSYAVIRIVEFALDQ